MFVFTIKANNNFNCKIQTVMKKMKKKNEEEKSLYYFKIETDMAPTLQPS